MYLYVYHDGRSGRSRSNSEPTEIDRKHIETGWLRVFKIKIGWHEGVGGSNPVSEVVEINQHGEEVELPTVETDKHCSFHYLPKL